MKKSTIVYFLLLQIILIVGLKVGLGDFMCRSKNNTPEQMEFYNRMVIHQTRKDGSVPAGSTIFIGDSLIQELVVNQVSTNAVNYGIGGDTTVGILNRLTRYKSLKNAKSIILAIGVNDLKRRDVLEITTNYKSIVNMLPADLPFIISAILPVDESNPNLIGYNQRINDINQKLFQYCLQMDLCTYSSAANKLSDESGNLNKRYHVGDGIHLSREGNAVWINELIVAVKRASKSINE